eukprot:TRINITY_DN3859_c0_g2_i3.p1 TRINITY_DN3859_c0_g2~~TRINITY_DN3859_c0_g2_i3.p1  ORF type:complete len:257 (+),score=56.34 TRINITY_DN3859_c0_g2_i3:282-1052(+)
MARRRPSWVRVRRICGLSHRIGIPSPSLFAIMSARRKVVFYYDVVSTYSFFAFETLVRYKDLWNLDLDLQPFFLGGVMKATNNKPPVSLPAKAQYYPLDIARNSRYFDIPIQIPATFPLNTIMVMRLLTAMKQKYPEALEPATRRFFEMVFGDKEGNMVDVTKEADVRASLKEKPVHGMDDDKWNILFEATQNKDVKAALASATDAAVQLGAFGAPWLFVPDADGGQSFWGSDRFPVIANELGLAWKGPVPTKAKL